MRSFSDINEKAGDTAVFTFGRFNPPTTGHEKLIDALAKQQSANSGSKMYVFPSQSQNPKKDPLPFALKVAYMRKMFPKYAKNIIASKVKMVFDIAVYLHNKGHRSIVMVVGSDRVTEFESILNKYNGVNARHGYYGFDNIEVVSAGERDPDAEGVSGMSASKMRSSASDGDFDTFKMGVPSGFKDALKLYNDVRKNMGIREERDMGEMTDFESLRDLYLTGKLWNIGDIVESKGVSGKVINKGTNYLSFVSEDGKVHKTWLYDIVERNYAQEYANYQGTPEQIARRSSRNKARRVMGDKVIQGLDVGHKDNNPMNNDPSNLKNEDPSDNRREPRLREVKQDKEIKGRDGTQPAKYYAKDTEGDDMSKSTKQARARHFDKKKTGPAPGDASATTKQSTHTKKFKQMFGEKLPAGADMGDYIDDFKKSDAPQFKGKSKDKRKDMAIAAYLDKNESLLDKVNMMLSEDGHTDVASMKNRVEIAMKALQKMQSELGKLGDEDDLPTWWTNKVSTAVSRLDDMSDYLDTKVEELQLEFYHLEEKIEGLVTKAEKSGMPYGILKKVYDRGMAAWKTGHRPGTTPQQWAFARVNSFVTKSSGTWGKADKDLAKQVNSSHHPEEVEIEERRDPVFKVSKGPHAGKYAVNFTLDRKKQTSVHDTKADAIKLVQGLRKNKSVKIDGAPEPKKRTKKSTFMKGISPDAFQRFMDKQKTAGLLSKEEVLGPESVQEWFESNTTRASYQLRHGDDWWWKLQEVKESMLEKMGVCCDDCADGVHEAKGPCWDNYKQVGMKMKGGKEVPNCVPESMTQEEFDEALKKVKGTSNLYEPRKKSKYARTKSMMDYMKTRDKNDADKSKGDKAKGDYRMRMYNSMENAWGEVTEKDDKSGKELNNPTRGDVKKYKDYVKNDKGNVVKVEFGDPNMSIKRDDPQARKNFRARHNCDQKKDKTTAGYWSCKFWSTKSVTDLMKG